MSNNSRIHTCVTWRILTLNMTLSYVWHDSCIYVTWLIHVCETILLFICMTWHNHKPDVTHSYVWHDSFICVTWLIHLCDMILSFICVLYVWRDTIISGTWLIHMCDRTDSYVWSDSLLCLPAASWGCTCEQAFRINRALLWRYWVLLRTYRTLLRIF